MPLYTALCRVYGLRMASGFFPPILRDRHGRLLIPVDPRADAEAVLAKHEGLVRRLAAEKGKAYEAYREGLRISLMCERFEQLLDAEAGWATRSNRPL